MRELCELPSAPAWSKMVWDFCAVQDSDNQPSSYRLPLGDASSDIDDCISSLLSGMHSKKVSKLLPYPGVHSRHYYRTKGEEVICHRILPRAINELGDMKSCNNLNKTDIVFTFTEVEDLEAITKALLEVTSWINWCFYTAKSLAMCDTNEKTKV